MKKVFLLIALICFSCNYLTAQTELFGVATSGGLTNANTGGGTGSIFKVDSNATNFSSQYFSTVINGYAPYNGSLLEANDGMIYGYARRPAGWSMLVLYQYDYRKNIYLEKFNSTSGLDGKEPMGALIQANDGLLYGLMNQGGVNDFGTLYSFNTVTNQFVKKIDFNISTGTLPEGSLFEASNGKMYGLARAGGLYNTGTMFEYDPTTNAVTVLVNFDASNANTGAMPKGTLTQGSDGLLYGMTTDGGGTASSGIIFSYDLNTNTFTKRKNFSASTGPLGIGTGAWPNDALIEGVDGNFYGLTMGSTGVWPCSGGTIFQFNPTTNTIITKYVFSLSLGTNPNGSLVLGPDGDFYGLTTNTLGGKLGSLFKYDYLNDIFTSKFVFDGYDYGGTPTGSLLQASNGKLYGITKEGGSSRSGGQVVHMGTLFEYDLALDTLNKKLDFGIGYNGQLATLMYSNGKLYGTTGNGGIHNDGTIFEYNLGTRDYTKLFDFDEYVNGAYPSETPTKVNDSTFYIVLPSGGVNGKGTIVKFNPISLKVTKLYDFVGGVSGENPTGSLLLASDGMLYGLTISGGNGNGILFQYNTTTNVLTNKFNFIHNTSGSSPIGQLLQASNGQLYGVTANGGPNLTGTLFQFDIVTNTHTIKYNFNSTITGSNPVSGLIQNSNGKIYGLTSSGGVNNQGVLFQYNPITNIYTKKTDFDGVNNGNPAISGSFIQTSNGSIFGTTSHGGLTNSGVIFKFDTLTNILAKTYDFVQSTGSMPRMNSLVEVPVLPLAEVTSSVSNICKTDSVTLSYSTSGAFSVGNVFNVELSNAYGYFNTPLVIATVTANMSGTVAVSIPSIVANGTGYKLRISSTNPYTIGFPTTGSINVVNQLNLNPISGTNTVCLGTSTTLNITGANTYTWNTGQTTSSINISPTITTTYTVWGTDINGCVNTQIDSVTVYDFCTDVWPGDANSDGIADNLDVLELGLHYQQTGSGRVTVSNNWQPYFADNWVGAITNGKNMNHSDCNGDGTINDDDTLAIYNNYGLTHTFKPAQTNTVNPQLSIVPDQPMVVKGMWGTASVYLGDAINFINSINGIAYTIDFDNTLIEPNSIYIEYQNSFIDAGQNLHFQKPDFTNGKIYSATTHTLSNNVSGYGKIATLHYQILSNLATDQVLNIGISQANQSNATGIISPLTTGPGTLMAIGASVGVKESAMSGNVLVSPNPTNGLLTISFSTIPQNTKIEVYNSIGALVLTEAMNNKNNTINVGELSSGMYFMKVMEGNKAVAVKKVVKE